MKNEKILKKEQRNHFILSAIIIGVSILIITMLIGLKLKPINPLLDDRNIATRDTIIQSDYYDQFATLTKAKEASQEVKNVVLKKDEKTYAAFDDIIRFFNTTDTYRTKISLSFQSDYSTSEDRNIIINNYIVYVKNQGMMLNEAQVMTLLSNISLIEYENFKNTYKVIFTGIQSGEIVAENIFQNTITLNNKMKKFESDANLIAVSEQLTNTFLRVNCISDIDGTNLLREKVYNNTINNYPVIIKKGSKLTTKGEVVNDNTIRLLNDMNLLSNKLDLLFLLNILIFIIIMLLPIITYKFVIIRDYRITPKQLLMINLVILVLFLFAFFIPNNYYLMIPVLMVPMLLSMLTNHKMAIIITIPLAILLTIMLEASVVYMIMVTIGGIVSVYLVQKTDNRLKYAASGIIIGFLDIIIIVTLSLIINKPIQSQWVDFSYIATAGILSSIISLGLLPVFESIFNIITPFKLLELSNPSKLLINRMLLEAPGTYHHSLMVGNLAEAGAKAIEANGLLARVGAYYHDIGKLNRPGFFTENQTSKINPHDKMTPTLSTTIITNHTKEGETLARMHKLPHAIRDIIIEHHGTTVVKYFYHKASQIKEVNEKDFRYPGPRPSSKESAVVMLADSVEASVRSMNKTSSGEIEGHIRKLIKERLDDGQLDLCDLTLKDLDEIASAFTKVFSGYFHSRIQYPNKDEIIDDRNNN